MKTDRVKNDEQITFRIPREIRLGLQKESVTLGMNLSDVIRAVLSEYVRRRRVKKS